jgi:predicted ATPase
VKVQKMRIKGLNNAPGWIEIAFHEDINILTGRNGAGKTTILKSIWYGISGNIEHLIREVVFESYEIETSSYILSVDRKESGPADIRNIESFTIQLNDKQGRALAPRKTESQDSIERGTAAGPVNVANRITVAIDDNSSVFFPTFRRIEGGFGMADREPSRYTHPRHLPSSQMQDALEALSGFLTTRGHQFVASTSTSDLTVLLNRKYAELSNKVNKDSENLLQNIFALVRRSHEYSQSNDADAIIGSRTILHDINTAASEFEIRRAKTFAPVGVLLNLVGSMLSHKGVRLTDTLIAGDAAKAIDSTKLSAGEKQMLSFLCYNAFASESKIFIDEPELSLHVDWQRQLVKTLVSQQQENQFFIATHSPFIYSQYADKEIVISPDRGFEDELPFDGAVFEPPIDAPYSVFDAREGKWPLES